MIIILAFLFGFLMFVVVPAMIVNAISQSR